MPVTNSIAIERNGPTGIGGWMLLLIAGLIFNLLGLLYYVYAAVFPVGKLYLTATSDNIDVLAIKPAFIWSAVSSLALALCLAYAINLIFRKKRRAVHILALCFLIDIVQGYSGFVLENARRIHLPDLSLYKTSDLYKAPFGGSPWLMVYCMVSRRARNTLIRPGW